MMIRRRLGLVLILTLLAAACASGTGESEGDEQRPATTGEVDPVPPPPQPTSTPPPDPTSTPADAGCADVVGVDVQGDGDVFTFTVTISSHETGWDKYADLWEVRAGDEVVGVRELAHPHVEEQPFTRSLTGVEIGAGVTEVEVFARDSVLGFCGASMLVALPGR